MRWVCLLFLLLPACFNRYAIKPTELPKLNGAGAAVVGQAGNAVLIQESYRQVEQLDGTLLEVTGPFDAYVQNGAPEPVHFKHPVSSEIDANLLKMKAGN